LNVANTRAALVQDGGRGCFAIGSEKIWLGASDNRLKSADWIYLNKKQLKNILAGLSPSAASPSLDRFIQTRAP
jgi:hypothetical protein